MGLLDKAKSWLFQDDEKSGQESMFGEDIAKHVNDEYRRRMTERRAFELQWRINTEFVNGNQYLEIDPATLTVQEIPRLYWYAEREVFNQIATIVESRIARLTRQKPIMKVRPASGDDKDISTAKICTMLVSSAWHDQDMDSKYSNLITWLEHTGTVFLKPIWNKDDGRLISRQINPEGVGQDAEQHDADDDAEADLHGDIITPDEVDQQLGLDDTVVEIREGDIDTDVVPAYEVFPDSSYRDSIELCRSIIHARAYHVNEIKEMWGVEVEAEDVDVMTLQRSQSSVGGLGYGTTTLRTAPTRLRNHAVVKEYYERSSAKYPRGRFIVVCGDDVLHIGPMPYMLGQDGEPEMPLIRIVSIQRPGLFWGATVVERCIPIQRRYNALRNRKAEYLNLVAIGQWYEPEGSIDDDTELNNGPGNRIRYRPGAGGAKPEPVVYPSLPASFEKEEGTLLAEFTAISGVSELSRYSQAPSGVKSGVALSIANEQDDTRSGITAAHIASGITMLGKYWIRLYRQFVQEPRLLRSIGPNYDVEVREWEASDLTSDDVLIENISALSETPAQRRQMVFDLLNAGLFVRPEMSHLSDEGRRKIFELLEFGHWESGGEDLSNLQLSRARRENKSIMSGQPAPVMDFDDHGLHMEQHNRQRMLVEYEELMKIPQIGPIIDQLMRQHLEAHMQALMNQQGQNQTAVNAARLTERMDFKDLPARGQAQMAEQVGIHLTQEEVQQHLDDKNKPKQPPQPEKKPPDNQTKGK